jgi:putative protease
VELTAYMPLLLLKKATSFDWVDIFDSIYIGEIFCEQREDAELASLIASKVKEHGKKIYISTSIMPTSEESLGRVRRYFEIAESGAVDGICVNDAGALEVGLREFPSVPLHIGPYLGVRSLPSAKIYEEFGAQRIALPHDLPLDDVRGICKGIHMDVEIVVHGSIPLLVSRRCLLLRAYGIREEEPCGLLCEGIRKGMPIAPLDSNDPIVVLGGRIAYSAMEYCLLEHLSMVKDAGVRAIRIEEWNQLHPEVYKAYREVLNGDDVDRQLSIVMESASGKLCNGWFFGKEGHLYVSR